MSFLNLRRLKIGMIFLFTLLIGKIYCQKTKQLSRSSKTINHEIKNCFRILDSLSKVSATDTIALNGVYCINYLTDISKILPSSDGSFVGFSYCTREDLRKWHDWYSKTHPKNKKKRKGIK